MVWRKEPDPGWLLCARQKKKRYPGRSVLASHIAPSYYAPTHLSRCIAVRHLYNVESQSGALIYERRSSQVPALRSHFAGEVRGQGSFELLSGNAFSPASCRHPQGINACSRRRLGANCRRPCGACSSALCEGSSRAQCAPPGKQRPSELGLDPGRDPAHLQPRPDQ